MHGKLQSLSQSDSMRVMNTYIFIEKDLFGVASFDKKSMTIFVVVLSNFYYNISFRHIISFILKQFLNEILDFMPVLCIQEYHWYVKWQPGNFIVRKVKFDWYLHPNKPPSFVCENLMNFTYVTIRFHNCHYAKWYYRRVYRGSFAAITIPSRLIGCGIFF